MKTGDIYFRHEDHKIVYMIIQLVKPKTLIRDLISIFDNQIIRVIKNDILTFEEFENIEKKYQNLLTAHPSWRRAAIMEIFINGFTIIIDDRSR